MGAGSYGGYGRLTRGLILANVALFVVQMILERWVEFPVDRYFYLSLEGLKEGYLFQLVTYQFLHDSRSAFPLHLLFNMLCLWLMGREVERILGPSRFLRLYFLAGVSGGVLQVLLALLPWFEDSPMVGASAAIFGIFACYARLFPDRRITVLLAFVLPVTFRGRTILWMAAGLAVFGILFMGDGQIAHGGHLGGLLGGALYAGSLLKGGSRPSGWLDFAKAVPRTPRRRDPRPARPASGDFVSRDIDPILEKISDKGIQSLTEEEREILRQAGDRIRKRSGSRY